jgi:signal peptidase II
VEQQPSEKKPLSKQRLFYLWCALAAALVAADQWIKLLIVEHFRYGEGIPITSFFNLVRVHNTGAAFSMLADAGGWQHWLFASIAIVVAVIILFMLHKHSQERIFSLALSCILGGAIGNLIDRLMHGYVVDYLDFYWKMYHFPAFNLADTAITVGVGLIILNELLNISQKKKANVSH